MTGFVQCVNDNIPDKVVDLFELDERGLLRWRGVKPASWRVAKRAPWGEIAGGRNVFKCGRLVQASRYNLLTCDLIYALQHSGEFAWQHGATVPYVAQNDEAGWIALARARWCLSDDCEVIWRETRGDRAIKGQTATGFQLSGFRGALITTGGMCFLQSDVKNLLLDKHY